MDLRRGCSGGRTRSRRDEDPRVDETEPAYGTTAAAGAAGAGGRDRALLGCTRNGLVNVERGGVARSRMEETLI